MKLVRLIADDATAALAQVQAQLGPEAVVLSVRRLPAPGLAWLWSRSRRVEVVAGVPDKTSAPPSPAISSPPGDVKLPRSEPPWIGGDRWRSVAWLETMGLLPAHADQLQSFLSAAQELPPADGEQEWTMTRAALSQFWRPPPPLADGAVRPHVFIGPPGSGKTTALCKWLTLATLLDGNEARVWRLDGSAANTAEFLNLHCETLGVPLERFWPEPAQMHDAPPPSGNHPSSISNSLWLVDLPGVEISDAVALAGLHEQLLSLPRPRVHLVLNAAYEIPALLAQWRAFEPCAPEDLIFTHLDEEPRRVKLWNFVFGTNCSVRFLAAGQKIPGQFLTASPEQLFPQKSL